MRSPRLVLALLLLVAPACDGGDSGPGDPDRALRDARARLAVLAHATANGVYDAEYRFVQLPSNTSGTIRIRQSPPQYRIDIESRDAAAFFALTTGVVSCSVKAKKRTCFQVAKPGEEVPALFDPGVQRLFRDAVEDLAANPSEYIVTRVDTPPSASAPTPGPSVPVGECFAVTRADIAPDPGEETGFEDGTYCFAEQGVATSISVASGTLTLVRLRAKPPAAAFKPIAKVQKLPEVPTPTATPSR